MISIEECDRIVDERFCTGIDQFRNYINQPKIIYKIDFECDEYQYIINVICKSKQFNNYLIENNGINIVLK